MNISAAIFDFNGTLFFDTDKHSKAWRIFGEKSTGRSISDEELLTHIHGRNNKLILTYLLGRTPTDLEVSTLGNGKEEFYRELCIADPDSFHLAPGAENFLDQLKENNIPCTIATSSDIQNINFYFENFSLSRWFKKELCVYEDGTFKSKPAPDIYLKAAAKLGVSPKDCTVFEDAVSGVTSAHSAGAGQIVAIASSADIHSLSKVPGVTHVVKDYTEIKFTKV